MLIDVVALKLDKKYAKTLKLLYTINQSKFKEVKNM
jgi:hypothetical protein